MHTLGHSFLWRRGVAAVALFFAVAIGIGAAGGSGVQQVSAQTALQVSAGGPYSGTTGFAVSMSGSADGALTPQFSWSFGDGTFGAGQVVSHTYNSAGVFPVTLTVTDLSTGLSASASSTATISGSATCIPGVTVPIGTACSNVVSCGFGVSVLFGTPCPGVTACGSGLSAFFGTGCAVGLSCGADAAAVLGTTCLTGATCVVGFSLACPAGFAATALGCTSGMAPCAVGQTCTPISSNQVFCTTAGSSAAESTAPTITVTTATPSTVDSCDPYDSSCVYCSNHPDASVCKPD